MPETILIKTINLAKDAPIVQYSTIDESKTTDCVFPGQGADPVIPAVAFETAVECLLQALQSAIPEVGSDERRWNLLNVAYLWDSEFAKWGFKVKMSGFASGAPLVEAVLTEKSNDQINDRVYAALEKLRHEAERYVKGVSAQLNLLDAVMDADDDTEEEEEAAWPIQRFS